MVDGTTRVYLEGTEEGIEEMLLFACKRLSSGKISTIVKDANLGNGVENE